MFNFQVTYTFRKPPCMTYNVVAQDEQQARKIADGYVRIEAAGYPIKKVTIKKGEAA